MSGMLEATLGLIFSKLKSHRRWGKHDQPKYDMGLDIRFLWDGQEVYSQSKNK